MVLLGLYLAQTCGTMTPERIGEVITALKEIPAQAEEVLKKAEDIKNFAQSFVNVEDTFLDLVTENGSLSLPQS